VRRALLALLGTLLVAVLAVLVAVPLLIQRNLSPEAVARRGSDLLGRPVSVASVGLAFRPALRIRAEDVRIEGAASADAVEVELALRPLLRGRLEPAELNLRRPRFLVERDGSGGLRVRLLHRPGHEGGGGGLPALPALSARDGEIALVDAEGRPAPQPTLRVRSLELARLSPEGRTPLRLEVALGGGPDDAGFGVGEAKIEVFLVLAGPAFRAESGRIEGRDLAVRRLRAERFAGRFAYGDGVATVEALTLSGYGGELQARGKVLGQPLRFEGDLELLGLELSDAIADARGRPLEPAPGKLSGRATVSLRLTGPDRGTGSGRVELRDGRLPAGSVFAAVLGSLGRLTGRLLVIGDASRPAPSRLESLTASVELRANRAYSEDADLVTDDYRCRATGSLGLDGSLDFSGRLALTRQGAQRMLASAALPLPEASAAVLPEIPVRVGGRLSQVSVTADATALPVAAKGTLTGLVRGGAGLVGDAARTGAGVLDRVLGR